MEIILDHRDGKQGIPLSFRDFSDTVPPFDPFAIPYESVLSFNVVFRKIADLAKSEDFGIRFLARELLKRLEKYPQLREPLTDLGPIEDHRDIFDLLFLFLINPLDRDTALFKVSRPFQFEPLYISKAMHGLMDIENACYSFVSKAQEVLETHLLTVCTLILRRCYGVDVTMTPTAMLTVPDAVTGLERFYKPIMDDDFVEVVVKGKLPPLSKPTIQKLVNNIHDSELWLKHLPVDKFSFHGFHLARLTEVTEAESLSRLKHRLISRDAILDIDRVKELAQLVRIHFRRSDLQLGLTAVDFPIDRAVDHEYRIRFNLLSDDVTRLTDPRYHGSIYDRVFRSGEMLVIEDLRNIAEPTEIERILLDKGFRSMLIAPLLNQEKSVIGLVELACPSPNSLNSFMEAKFQEIRGLFRTAVERSREYIDNRIEAIMREQYTSLHPSVEWRFTDAAYNILKLQEEGGQMVTEEIRFAEVFPLYGQADIVGSSNLRNTAIYQDLFDNLRAGRHFLVRALELVDFPIINQAIMSLDVHLKVKLDDFNNGHEIKFGDFIHNQLSPLIRQLGDQVPDLRDLSKQYFSNLNSELGLFYRVRRDYERSVSTLNRVLSDFFTERDQASQRVLPHYFEKYKTDGVEYEIYAGQSLLKRQTFSNIHLRNLRISQLVDMCEITRRVEQLSTELPMPLRTAQLIFAYTTPLDIRFRMDEKRFDVDGDYNVRYEILKKRIDKATILNGSERLTQPGMVSIVYLQDRDLEEYQDYLHYLHQADYIEGEVEHLTLDPLQSVNGLRALRFRVKL